MSLTQGSVPIPDLLIGFTQLALLDKGIFPAQPTVTGTIINVADVLLDESPKVQMPLPEFEALPKPRVTLAAIGELSTYLTFAILEIIKCLHLILP